MIFLWPVYYLETYFNIYNNTNIFIFVIFLLLTQHILWYLIFKILFFKTKSILFLILTLYALYDNYSTKLGQICLEPLYDNFCKCSILNLILKVEGIQRVVCVHIAKWLPVQYLMFDWKELIFSKCWIHTKFPIYPFIKLNFLFFIFSSSLPLLHFCLIVFSVFERAMLKYTNSDLSFSHSKPLSFSSYTLDAYMFTTANSFWWSKSVNTLLWFASFKKTFAAMQSIYLLLI